MPQIRTRNVNTAFREIISGIQTGKIPTEVEARRYGKVALITEPLTLIYTHPRERVLFNAARDVNPFALLYESLWMLAGRNDVEPLAYYTPRFREFSNDGVTLNDAYGYRWRYSQTSLGDDSVGPDNFEYDQIKALIDHLRRKPESRRAVLQMWNVADDLLQIDDSNAVCCNLSCVFKIENGKCRACNGTGEKSRTTLYDENNPSYRGEMICQCGVCKGKPHDQPSYLNMTVFNRSNDLIWGTLGANMVTFSVLQEYVAAHLGLEVGVYNQISCDAHVYTEAFEAEKWLAWDPVKSGIEGYEYSGKDWKPFPLVRDPVVFDRELPKFVERFSGKICPENLAADWREPFFQEVAEPMLIAFACYKEHAYHDAFTVVAEIAVDDWRVAAENWIRRRKAQHFLQKYIELVEAGTVFEKAELEEKPK